MKERLPEETEGEYAQRRLKEAEPEFKKKWAEKNQKELREKLDKDLICLFWQKEESYEQARVVLDKFPLYYDKFKKWWIYCEEKRTWSECDEHDVFAKIRIFFGKYYSESKFRNELINVLKDESRIRAPEKLDRFEIQIGRYIYNITNEEKYLAHRGIRSEIYIPHDIDLVAENELPKDLDSIFEEWVDDRKDVLYDIIAFMMSPVYFLDISFWLHGSGANGKGLFQVVMKNVLGYENITAQDLELLSDPKDRFTRGFLNNKLCCSLGDGNFGILKDTGGLKMLSGCTDLIRCELKGAGQFDFENRAKLIGAYNTLPQTLDKTKGFYRRNHCTKFEHDFAGKENPLPKIDAWEYTIMCKICLDKLREIYKTNKIKGWLDNWKERKDYWEDESDPVKAFIEENMEEDLDYYFFGKTFYKEYSRWATLNGKNSFTLDIFESMLANNGYTKKRKDVYHANGLCWGKLKTIPEEYLEDGTPNKDKYNVFCGLKLKSRQNRQKRQEKEINKLRIETKNKNTSFLSKTSKKQKNTITIATDFILDVMDDHKPYTVKELSKSCEMNLDLISEATRYLKTRGDIAETKPGVFVRAKF